MLKLSPRLLVRPQHVEHESLRGYVSRVSDCNGSSPLLTPALTSLRATTSALEEIATLTGTQSSILEVHCSLKLSENGKYAGVVFGDTLMPISRVWMQRRMICPVCLSKNGISQCFWELSAYDVCHLHGCYMVGSCHACNRPIHWACASKDRCICGVRFTEIKKTAAPSTRINRCDWLAAATKRTLCMPNKLEKFGGVTTDLNWFFVAEKFI